jgi:hypothetical protein
MDNDQQFAIVPYTGRAPEEAIITGNLSQVTEYIPQSVARNERDQQLAQAERDAEETERFHDEVRARALQILGNGVTRIGERLDAFEVRKAEREEQQRRDAEAAEAEAIELMLQSLPDLDQPRGDDGDFEIVLPVDPEKHNPEGEVRAENISGLTPEQLEEDIPPGPGDYTQEVTPEGRFRIPGVIGGV